MPCCRRGADGAHDARKKRGKSGVFKVCNMLTMPAIFPSIGATFGRLSFLGDGGSSPGRTRRWRMQCACGTEKLFRSDLVRAGRSQSCGCLQREVARAARIDIAGQRFGRLVAVRDTGRTGSSGAIWDCLCDCGVEKAVTVQALRRGATISCGCAKVDQPGLMSRAYLAKSAPRLHARRARSRAALAPSPPPRSTRSIWPSAAGAHAVA